MSLTEYPRVVTGSVRIAGEQVEVVGGEGRNRTLTVASFEKRKSLTSTQILNDSEPIRRSCQCKAILHYPRTILALSLQYPFTIRLLELLLEVRAGVAVFRPSVEPAR